MAYCTFSYTASGSQTSWSLPFEYIDASSIKVYVNGALAVIDTDYTFDENTNTITFSSTPTSGTIIKIYRNSDIVDGYSSFTEGSVLTAEDLNATIEQSLQALQEVSDRIDTVTTDGCLLAENNLSDLESISEAQSNLGLGTAALLNVGTSANNIVQLDASAKLPAIDGSQLTNLPAGSGTVTGASNVGTGSGVFKDLSTATLRFKSIKASTNISVTSNDDEVIISSTTFGVGDMLKSDNLSGLADKATARGNLDLGSASTLTAGTSANNVVQLTAEAKLPAVDGSLLTNLPAGGDMYKADNLSGLASKSTARSNLDLGSASTLNAGTGANEVLKLDADGKIASTIGFASPSSTRTALELGSASLLNAGTSALNLIQLDADAKYPSALEFSSPSTTRSKLELGNASLLNASATGANDVLKLDAAGKIPSTIVFASTSSARAALELGDSSTKNVGSTTGTVCAGDDSRLSGNLRTTNNLSDLTSASDARTQLGLGTAATLSVGTSANNIVQLDGSALLPAVSAVNLTNVTPNASQVCMATLSSAQELTVGTPAIVAFDGTAYNLGGGTFSTGSHYYQPSVAGFYMVSGYLDFSITGNPIVRLAIIKSGSTAPAMSAQYYISGNATGLTISSIIALSASDYVQLQAYNNTGGSTVELSTACTMNCVLLRKGLS